MALKEKIEKKPRLHSRNKNRERYDLNALVISNPELKKHIFINKYGIESVDFSNPSVVKVLNQALLHHYYGVKYWDFPTKNLCPPIPGRADYIHYIADLLAESNLGKIPTGNKIKGLDIGIGASCIYPIIGNTEYNWTFVGTDIDPKSIASAQTIIQSNSPMNERIECRLQENSKNIFKGIIKNEERFDFTICNPPFHSSIEEAKSGSLRKIKNLSGKNTKAPKLNFSGINNELIYGGGEYQFIANMIQESELYAKKCYWFTTLVSKQSNLKGFYKLLEKTKACTINTIPMATGNKFSRIVAWTFLSEKEQKAWREDRF